MAEEIRIWQVENGEELLEINRSKLDFEERLENWLNQDISILSDDLLIIGRQVETDYGKYIDLLCLNSNGDLVIVELKKDKTPREVTAQVLDYASWVKELSHERILNIANLYLAQKNTNLEQSFRQKVSNELPEILNNSHSMLIVASEIDESTERIIKYLSDSYGVNINVAQFQYFKNINGQEFLARVFLIEQSEVEQKAQAKGTSKRAPNLTYEELKDIAKQNGVENLYEKIVEGLKDKFYKGTTRTQINFKGNVSGKLGAIVNILPPKSSAGKGLAFEIYFWRFAEYTELAKEKIIDILPQNREDWAYPGASIKDRDFSGYEGYFVSENEVEKFLTGLQNIVRH